VFIARREYHSLVTTARAILDSRSILPVFYFVPPVTPKKFRQGDSIVSKLPNKNFTLHRWFCLCCLTLLVAAIYANSLRGPFVFDDIAAIVENPTIRSLGAALRPPAEDGVTVGGRPLLNFTFALNYAVGGLDVFGYHLLNVAIHALAALTLFGLARRTLLRPGLPAGLVTAATPLAFLIAALWAAHPLQTEAVTQIVQRAESLAGLFYLLTLYAFVRAAEGGGGRWLAFSVAACLLGVATKETVATAPLAVLLYDRTFVAGGFLAACRTRRRYYGALAATWLLLCGLAWAAGGRGGSAGFNTGLDWGRYLLAQAEALPLYLRLALWPRGLTFDYGTQTPDELLDVAGSALVLCALAIATVYALWRHPRAGFLGAWFFLVHAPTALVPVATQVVAERRMYLPLAALAAGAVAGAYLAWGRRVIAGAAVATLTLAAGTVARNADYGSAVALWSDTVAKRPANPRARNNLGLALTEAGRPAEAVPHLREALRLAPDYFDARNNLGNALAAVGRPDEAVAEFQQLIAADPDNAVAHYNLARVIAQTGHLAEAARGYEAALRRRADFPAALNELGHVLIRLGNPEAAEARFRAALQLAPDDATLHNNLGNALAAQNKVSEALASYQNALRLVPTYATARFNLGSQLLQLNRDAEAALHLEDAARLAPDDAEARARLALALARLGRRTEARWQAEAALQIDHSHALARSVLQTLR
jgi:protein O-mannosyl-transferase